VSEAREIRSGGEVREVLQTARTVAVLGFNPQPDRPANFVPQYLHDAGYRVIPVNPGLAGRGGDFHGERTLATLAEIGEAVDVVDVFRRPESLPGHLEDILAMRPAPKVVWLQSGIRNDAFAAALLEAGISVVQDRCMLVDHRSMGLGRRA